MPGTLSDKDKQTITDAFQQAARDAGYAMKVCTDLGDMLRFSGFERDGGTRLALNYVVERATQMLHRSGLKLRLGDGGVLGEIMPDRYTIITRDKRVYGAVTWES